MHTVLEVAGGGGVGMPSTLSFRGPEIIPPLSHAPNIASSWQYPVAYTNTEHKLIVRNKTLQIVTRG
jgi:hypothetical protein